jgi:hypothetical protein
MGFKKNIFFIILIGFLISSITGLFYLKKYDQISNQTHSMIRGDIKLIWIEAEELKRDLYDGKNYFNSGREYTRTYLPSKILALYSHISGQELFENFENKKIKKGYEKLTFLILQSLIYYLALFFFHQKILDFYNYNYQKCFFITSFLAIEPTIIQWHSSFWTESIFFSLQLITLSLIIHKTNNKFFNFLIGIFIGLMYLQKTVAMFFIFPVIFYFIVSKKRGNLISILNLIFGFLIILFILGYHNFKKTGIFYLAPEQSKNAHYQVLAHQILSKKNNVPEYESIKSIKQLEKKWIKDNAINLNNFEDRRRLSNYRQKFFLNTFLSNKIIATKIYTKQVIHHTLLNPVQVYFWYKYNNSDNQYHRSLDHEEWIWKRILYSSIIYFFVLIGIYYSLRKKEYKNFIYFIILSIFYFMFMLGWVGNTRYFMPSLILISIFFGEGAFIMLQKFSKNNNIS